MACQQQEARAKLTVCLKSDIPSCTSPQPGEDDRRVEDILQLHHLRDLLHVFNTHKPPDRMCSSSLSPGNGAGVLSLQEFKAAMTEVLKTRRYESQLDTLFAKLDISHDNSVDWNGFSTYLLQQLREKDFLGARTFRPFQTELRIRHILHNRQETTIKVVVIDNPTRYITISREGAAGVWNSNLHLRKTFSVTKSEEGGQQRKTRVKMWITDAVLMSNCRKLVVSTTGRDLHFFDLSTGQYNPEFHLYGLEEIPCCLDYSCKTQEKTSVSGRLYVGDEAGNIHTFTFLQPHVSLFNVCDETKGHGRHVYFPDLRRHAGLVEHTCLPSVHNEAIRRLLYLPENGAILSASIGSTDSLKLIDESGKRNSYVFKSSKEVECFVYSKALNVLVTGSPDHVVRVWNPYVTARPVARLRGHAVGVVDVAIQEQLLIIISYSKDAVLKVWDYRDHTCLQTVYIKFPCIGQPHCPLLDHGPFSLCLTPHGPGGLLVAGQDYLAQLPLAPVDRDHNHMSTTHSGRLSAALYNPYYKQVVTAAEDSTISMWDIETGRRHMTIPEAHGREEITCIAFDVNYQRLISGSHEGSLKTWNVQTGRCMQQLERVDDAEVTGAMMLTDRPVILAVGSSRTFTLYDSNPETPVIRGVAACMPERGQHRPNADILSVAYLPPSLLATGDSRGDILIWTMDTNKLLARLSPELRERVPIDTVRFLARPTREGSERGRPRLISSQGGNVSFWSIGTSPHHLGMFYAPVAQDELVFAICTEPDGCNFYTGDSGGNMSVWHMDADLTAFTQIALSRPIRSRTWLGHEGAIVSLEYICYDEHTSLLLSASTDRMAKLWSVHGHCVGTFGQKSVWQLHNQATWLQHTGNHGNGTELTKREDGKHVKQREYAKVANADTHSTVPSGASNPEEKHTSPISPLPEVSLGRRVNQELRRRTTDRRRRRTEHAEWQVAGGGCSGRGTSPFHCLQVKPLADIDYPLL